MSRGPAPFGLSHTSEMRPDTTRLNTRALWNVRHAVGTVPPIEFEVVAHQRISRAPMRPSPEKR
jgi:hypothetical protein